MIIKEVEQLINNNPKPVIKILHRGVGFKCIIIGLDEGVILPEHTTSIPAKLSILEGKITYIEGDKEISLNKFETIEIPLNTVHSLHAQKKSICLLTSGN
jgi:quercetin dioxygenase-like cupin family protein